MGIATEQELSQRIEALCDAGWNRFITRIARGRANAIKDWGRIGKAFA